ncbi:hypothetical protein CLV67_12310 [Actinoplanes italicus]|uniref:Uncharacterized protein n=1 Tax=Actinoplanes italicus TaxID=113567 RepID=A0A2T0JZ55_9ACTN|nr:hypothetical protein CLV67_12310 [Actinoplanes italicus]
MPETEHRREATPYDNDRPLAITRSILVAGGGFGTTIATILGVAGQWQLGDAPTLWALCTLCVVASMTMFVVAYLVRPHS